jgi:hypothetical protein
MSGHNIAQAVGGRFLITEVPVQSQGRKEGCPFSLVNLRFLNDPYTLVTAIGLASQTLALSQTPSYFEVLHLIQKLAAFTVSTLV